MSENDNSVSGIALGDEGKRALSRAGIAVGSFDGEPVVIYRV